MDYEFLRDTTGVVKVRMSMKQNFSLSHGRKIRFMIYMSVRCINELLSHHQQAIVHICSSFHSSLSS